MQTDKKRILSVSGDLELHELLAVWLSEYELVTATTIAAAHRLLEEQTFALILFDEWLCERKEVRATAELWSRSRHTPLIVFSTDTRPAAQQRALENGAQVFLLLPIDPFQLAAAVALLVGAPAAAVANAQLLADKCDELQARARLICAVADAASTHAASLRRRSYQACEAARRIRLR